MSAALILAACGLATAHFGRGLQMPATTARDGTLVTLNRYINNPVPDVVLVGSSLTFRLREEYFATPGLRNLALAGGSPVTGLTIVANQRRLPKLIVVETNVLSRKPDTALIERFSATSHQELFFRPVRAAIAAYENFSHAPATHEQVAASLRRVIAQPPSNFDNRIYLARAVQERETEDPTAAAMASVAEIARLSRALEQRGARVLLMELPCEGPIEAARYTRITREIVRKAFPDARQWLSIDVDRTELRWADGVHLDERSAILVSQALDGSLGKLESGGASR
ncbi:hypothetical protein [Bradyrhizobium sp. ARR65]|uniref:hypothetical protein n=1 Tax=Bradyrhizobium sp. ARR65 TaxID=1040989 RepID=UPI0004667600|nr:hypothetical protein [Bradyrhizobium sp. ARR65]